MNSMGSACSMQRHRSAWRESQNEHQQGCMEEGKGSPDPAGSRRPLRHSVVSAVPDSFIANLYPTSDNYVTEDNNLRSPKRLADLCTDTLCRSLPNLDGELPPGLPQDVVDDIVASLVKHSALNATTLKVLRNCELCSLSLAGCRGVTDEWLEQLSSPKSMDSPPQLCPLSPGDVGMDSMDLDDCDHKKPHQMFYNSSFGSQVDSYSGSTGSTGSSTYHEAVEDSSCSTSSFVTASSTPYVPSSPPQAFSTDHLMVDADIKAPATSLANMVQCMAHVPSMPMDPYTGAPMSITSNLTLLDLRGSQRLTDNGLMQLSDLTRLEVAKLDNCHSIVGRGLLAFANSHRLHTLSLANCRRLTDEAILNISHLSSLEALSLDGCRCLTDRSLAAIADLLRLCKLDLSQCDLLTDSGLHHLENLDAIDELSLGWCRLISDEGLDILTKQPGRASILRILRLARCSITDKGVEHLARLSALEELNLNGCSHVGSAALGDTLAKLPNLTSLDVSYCPGILRTSWQGKICVLKSLELCYSSVRDTHLSKLVNLPALQELNLDSCPVGDWAIAHLADNNVVPNLTSLDLADTDLTDLGMVHLAKFQKLTKLSLFYCNITNGGLRHLANLTSLEVLNLDSREIGDHGLWHLRNLKKLKSLDIFSGRITDSGCAYLSKIHSLESLELCGGSIGDLGCTLLASLENLTSLNLSQNERITNRGAAALAALTNLKALNLSNTRVNSSALMYFSGLLKLQSLALYGCRGIEDDGYELNNLQNGLPGLKCIRLSNMSADDGTVMHHNDDLEQDSDSDGLFPSDARITGLTAAFQSSDSDDDSDDDSDMEDADFASSGNSGDSSSYYSDHD